MAISFIRTAVLYLLVIAILRVMGKRQIGQLQPSELVVAIMISDLAAIPMQNTGTPLLAGVIPIITLMILEVALSFFSSKNDKFSRFVCGTPSILIKDGEIIEEEMKRLRFSRNDLLEELRISGCDDVSQVQYAILETNGGLGLIMKEEYRPLTLSDAKQFFKENK